MDTTLLNEPDPFVPPSTFPWVFGRYRVDWLIAKGGMGVVYFAFDTTLQMPVALKFLKPVFVENPDTLDLFWREARLLPWLHHPHICRIFNADIFRSVHYIAMAYIEGSPLNGDHAATPLAAAELVRTLALALPSLHQLGFIHRDLKPANVLITASGEPVVIDFGLILDISEHSTRKDSDPIRGTIAYMAPEQARRQSPDMGPWSDVFSLGIILYELLAGLRPFLGSRDEILQAIADPLVVPKSPAEHVSDLPPRLVAICMKALTKSIADRYQTTEALAADLTDFLAMPKPGGWWSKKTPDKPTPEPPRTPGSGKVKRDRVRFSFVGHGEVAPRLIEAQDRLYLDVGNALRPAVIDHHQGGCKSGSASSAVLDHPEFVRASLRPWRADGDPFVIVLHREPDIDAIASAFLALELLCDGDVPSGARRLLATFVDAIDRGEPGLSLDQPFTAYSAIMQVAHRLSLMNWASPDQHWTEATKTGMRILDFALTEAVRQGKPLAEVDAFDCLGLFAKRDRLEVTTDINRYNAKLADPATHARSATLRLPRPDGTLIEVDALLARYVQNADDPDRCIFFKDWARTDRQRAPRHNGFVALCVIEPGASPGTTRGILSVRPDVPVMLDGLGQALEQAEVAKRTENNADDARWFDKSGNQLPARPGYDNPDPWYDGRAQEYTIVDAPRAGSKLSADEIEAIFLEYGGAVPDGVIALAPGPR